MFSSTDPETIIDTIEEHLGQNARDPYWARLEALMLAALERHEGPDEAGDARLLRQTTGGLTLETAARHVGFLLGVEYCRRLMEAGRVH